MSLRHNTLWNLAGTGLPFVVGLVTIPYIIRHIGVEAFGILTLIWALIGYFSLFDLGLGRALTQKIASRLGSRCEGEIPHLAKSGLVFTACTGVVGGLVLASVAAPLGHVWLKVDAALSAQASHAFLIAALGIPLATLTTGLRGISEAYEDFRPINIVRLSLGTANFGLPALSVMLLGPSLAYIVATLVAARLGACLAQWWLAHRRLPAGWMGSAVRGRDIKNLLSFGAWMTVSNIVSPIMVMADRFVIAAVLGAGVVAYYTVPLDIMIRILILPAALTGALFPRLTQCLLSDKAQARALYVKCIRLVAGVIGPICFIAAAGSYWALTLWLGHDFASKSWPIVSILSLGILLNAIAFVPFATVQAAGDARATAILNCVEFLLYVPLLFVFLYWFGIVGAAAVWVCRAALDMSLLLALADRVFKKAPSAAGGDSGSGQTPVFTS